VLLMPGTNIGIYDPANNTLTDGPAHGKGDWAFLGGLLLPNGKVLLVPANQGNIGIYDPVGNTFTNGPATGKAATAFMGGVLLPDGKVVLVPASSPNIGLLSTGLERSLALCLSPFINKF